MSWKEECVAKNYVYNGKIITVRCDDALDGAGNPCKREIIEHPGGACALYEADGKIAFVRQYRYAYGEDVLEIPAGKLDKGEDPKLAALRELEEETGITASADDAELLFVMYPTPGYTNEKIYIYYVKKGVQAASHPDEGEFVETLFIPVPDVKKMLSEGQLNDGKTIIALQAYFLKKAE